MTRAQVSQTVRGYRRAATVDLWAIAFVFAFVFAIYGAIILRGLGIL